MRGIKILFQDGGPVFDLENPVKDFDATVQNALVNTGTRLNSDAVYPDRGTELMKDAAAGRMVNLTSANHMANFAALRTLAFIQKTEKQSNPFKLQDFKLRSRSLKDQHLELDVKATSVTGEVRGSVAEL